MEAQSDPRREAEVMKMMLDTVLYVLMPFEAKADRLQFVQFIRPDDAQSVLPFFSDQEKAKEAAAGSVRVVPMLGRNIFQFTLGATLMLDPNERNCVFYPEEIESILKGVPLGYALPFVTGDSGLEMAIGALDSVPVRLAEALRDMCTRLPAVKALYLALLYTAGRPDPSLVAACLADSCEKDHVMRALNAAMQPHLEEPRRAIDIAMLEPSDQQHLIVVHGTQIYPREP